MRRLEAVTGKRDVPPTALGLAVVDEW